MRRWLALGGLAGPASFVGAWASLGARREGYSPVEDAISELAAVGASTRPVMTAGFIAFGVGVPLYALALREQLGGRSWITAAATGVATLGVAAFPLEASPAVDAAHGVFAGLGYATLAATPWLAASSLEGRAATIARVTAVVSAASLAASVAGPAHGLLQRLGLTVTDVWIAASAIALLRSRLGPEHRASRHTATPDA